MDGRTGVTLNAPPPFFEWRGHYKLWKIYAKHIVPGYLHFDQVITEPVFQNEHNQEVTIKETNLGKVADNVVPFVVHLTAHVEEERVCVIVECLMVQEQLSQQTQVLGIVLATQSTVLVISLRMSKIQFDSFRTSRVCVIGCFVVKK